MVANSKEAPVGPPTDLDTCKDYRGGSSVIGQLKRKAAAAKAGSPKLAIPAQMKDHVQQLEAFVHDLSFQGTPAEAEMKHVLSTIAFHLSQGYGYVYDRDGRLAIPKG